MLPLDAIVLATISFGIRAMVGLLKLTWDLHVLLFSLVLGLVRLPGRTRKTIVCEAGCTSPSIGRWQCSICGSIAFRNVRNPCSYCGAPPGPYVPCPQCGMACRIGGLLG